MGFFCCCWGGSRDASPQERRPLLEGQLPISSAPPASIGQQERQVFQVGDLLLKAKQEGCNVVVIRTKGMQRDNEFSTQPLRWDPNSGYFETLRPSPVEGQHWASGRFKLERRDQEKCLLEYDFKVRRAATPGDEKCAAIALRQFEIEPCFVESYEGRTTYVLGAKTGEETAFLFCVLFPCEEEKVF